MNEQVKCTICLEKLGESNNKKLTWYPCLILSSSPGERELSCGHLFHDDCIKQWLDKNDTCHVCRCDTRGFIQNTSMVFRQIYQSVKRGDFSSYASEIYIGALLLGWFLACGLFFYDFSFLAFSLFFYNEMVRRVRLLFDNNVPEKISYFFLVLILLNSILLGILLGHLLRDSSLYYFLLFLFITVSQFINVKYCSDLFVVGSN